MKWVLFGVGGIVALIAAMAAIGAMLPRGHRATRRARFKQKPEAIYAVLSGPPDWRSDLKEFGDLPDKEGRKQWWELSQGQKITYELVEDLPPKRRVTRIADKSLPFGGTWTLEIVPEGDGGAALRVTEDGEVYNVIFRFMSRFIFGQTGTIERFLKDLGRKFGEQVEIEA
jgi:hypothetical protein